MPMIKELMLLAAAALKFENPECEKTATDHTGKGCESEARGLGLIPGD